MTTFLIVYKHNASIAVENMTYICDGAPCLSDIQMKIINKHIWKLSDFAVLNIIPIKTEISIDNL